MTQAGGAMAPSNITRLTDALPEIDFFVMYGQTEATARLSYLPPDNLKSKLGSIGIAIPGVSLAVKDDAGRDVACGEIGQIYAKGPNIMQGYWKDPEATDRVIVDGWLQTGDLAKQDKDGYIYIIGRSSEMIKSGANRISPKDIEEVITELDSVEEVAVVGRQDDILGEVIEAYIVISPGSFLDSKQVQAHCRKNLSTYKIPKKINFVNELPKTASGKVKRFLLVGDDKISRHGMFQ
jgi:acyl-CoA synthetase (AMP-forming)/AMP-acid ligase II